MNDRPKILYPALVVAAIAVTVLSFTGIAAMTGLLPKANANAPAASVATVNPQETNKGEMLKQDGSKPEIKQDVKQASNSCTNCGTVESVRIVEHKGQGSGLGAVAGGVAGAVLGNQVGKGNGRTVMTLAGAGGGAYLGNEIEKSSKKSTSYQIRVRMVDGTMRTLSQKEQPGVSHGDHVRVSNGVVTQVL